MNNEIEDKIDLKRLDFAIRFSNYTGRSLEELFEAKETKQELINEIIKYFDKKPSRQTMEQMELEKVKFLKILLNSFDDLLKEDIQH